MDSREPTDKEFDEITEFMVNLNYKRETIERSDWRISVREG